MTMIADVYKLDGEKVTQALSDARENLNNTGSEVTLDFSGVRRIDPKGLAAMEDLASAAAAKSVKIVLRGVNVDVYKVLKLARVAPRFTIEN
ncbi:MAG: STAS domain-containing protein [Candidatus Korobacteraceae bacterium]